MRPFLREFGFPEETLDEVLALRLAAVRRALAPRPGAVETLHELRRRGLRLGMISVCSEEVELAWPDTEFAGLFDAEVFSCSFGACKPEPEIYLACCDALGVEPADAVFVGDGANDELAGARRVGMDAILIHRPGRDPYWPELHDWDGPRIDSIPGVLELLEEAPC
jgi:putative hydrolase of the HAD superfamily